VARVRTTIDTGRRAADGAQRVLLSALFSIPVLALAAAILLFFLAGGLDLSILMPLWLVPLVLGAAAFTGCALVLRQRRSTERQIQDLRAKITSEGDQARRLSGMVGDLRGLAELEVAQLERVQWTWNSCCVTCWMTRTKDPRAGTPNNAGSPCTCPRLHGRCRQFRATRTCCA